MSTEPGISFGEWFRKKREEKGFGLDDLEKESGVSIGTISRAENDVHQVTLNTAFKICYGLNLSANDLLLGLMGRTMKVTPERKAGVFEGGTNLTVEALIFWGNWFEKYQDKGINLLSTIFNYLLRPQEFDTIPYSDIEIIRLLRPERETPWQTNNVSGPDMDSSKVLQIYRDEGVVTRLELYNFLADISNKKRKGVGDKEISEFWNKHKTKSEGWAVKLEDLLELDEFLTNAGVIVGGEVLGLWWNNEYYNTQLYRPLIETALKKTGKSRWVTPTTWSFETAKSTLLFHKTFRWLEQYGLSNTIVAEIRDVMKAEI